MSSNVLKTADIRSCRENGPTNFGYKFVTVMSRMSSLGLQRDKLSHAVPSPRMQKD